MIQFLLQSHITEEEEELRETASSFGEKVFTTGLAGPVKEVAVSGVALSGAIIGGAAAPTTTWGPSVETEGAVDVGGTASAGDGAVDRDTGGGGGIL